MKNVFLVLSFCFYFSAVAQHKIVFSKTDSSANVEVELKDNVKLSYSGYMGQPQEAEGIVTLLNDSIISLTPRKKLLQKKQPAQTLYVRDISGFRKYSSFRPAGEIIYGVVGIGIAGTVTTIVGGVVFLLCWGFYQVPQQAR